MMDPNYVPPSFKGSIFFVWKGNRPCRIYVTGEKIYFIRRTLGFARDDEPAPPDRLVSRHADNFAIPVSDIVGSRIEPRGKFMSYGKNEGRWHFTRRGDAKETVVLLESPADASLAAAFLSRALPGESDLVTNMPIPEEQAEIVDAMRSLTRLLGEHAPSAWQQLRCDVRVAPPGSPSPLQILVTNGNTADERLLGPDPAIDQAAVRVARTLSSSLSSFPGLIIDMTRIDRERWHNKVRLKES